MTTLLAFAALTPGQPAARNVAKTTARRESPTPVQLAASARMDAAPVPLSALARLGQKIFFDPSLSASGKMSCSTCHSPTHAYAPVNSLAAQLGGTQLQSQGSRAVPTLTYLERTPRFKVGLDTAFDPDSRSLPKASRPSLNPVHNTRSAGADPVKALLEAQQIVPEGGMDWDGRAAVLADQAGGPLLDPREMANPDSKTLLAKLQATSYAKEMKDVLGPKVFNSPEIGLKGAYAALARFQLEDRSFHSYTSKYDFYLAGRTQLSAQEVRGLKLFDDSAKGNCAACHLDKPTKNRQPPAFTDYEFEALAVPRNRHLLVNSDAGYFDEGLCGPYRKDAAKESYCGLFKTPTLRNVATRHVFFHNGSVRTLEDAVRFYVERETRPEKWYGRSPNGSVNKYDDLPPAHRANVDIKDAPFDRHRGDPPALSPAEIKDVVAFLKTLTDGFQPPVSAVSSTVAASRPMAGH